MSRGTSSQTFEAAGYATIKEPLPSGTVTFLFTDIERSTQRWEGSTDVMSSLLVQHDAILKNIVDRCQGTVFKMMGDAGCAAFSTAPDALRSAIAIQSELSKSLPDIRVRMVLHTGAAEERDGDYFGPPVNRVARLLSAGHGGQVLLSAPTYELLRDRLPDDVSLLDLGEHRLKDLTRPEHVYQVVLPDAGPDFPPLKTLDARPTNLPIQPSPLIGREKEIAELCDLIRDDGPHLITLTGPAGTGKTRLALQTGAELLEEFADGVFFVPLAPVSDPDGVLPAIAAALDVRETGSRSLAEVLAAFLKRKHMLLILDNFEQVVEAATHIGTLLSGSSNLTILVTSRTLLQLYGECQYAVPALSVPDPAHLPSLDTLSQYESVALFIQRARAIKRDFSVTNDNAPAVAEICVRLDGLPLAIELAAARIGMLPPKAILDRLSSRLTLLTGGARDVPQRHRTLRSAIEWSYDLLNEEERALFRRLGVFVGGWTLEGAEAVCNPDGEIEIFEGLASLVQKSLVRQVEGVGDEPRFDMLETVREFAIEQMGTAEDGDAVRTRHAEYFLAFALEAEPEIIGPKQVQWLDRLVADHGNLLEAMSWWIDQGDGDRAQRLGCALYEFWGRR